MSYTYQASEGNQRTSVERENYRKMKQFYSIKMNDKVHQFIQEYCVQFVQLKKSTKLSINRHGRKSNNPYTLHIDDSCSQHN